MILLISGPSGVGKGTLIQDVLKIFPQIKLSVSYTTRAPRGGEVNGKQYHFISKEEFLEKIALGFFLECKEYGDHLYGTPKHVLSGDSARPIILELEVEGAFEVIRNFPEVQSIFILPPSLQELERRLIDRGTETEEKIRERLAIASRELQSVPRYKYVIVNDDYNTALKILGLLIGEIIRGGEPNRQVFKNAHQIRGVLNSFGIPETLDPV